MIRSAILTISDRCSEGKQEDLSGLEIEKILKENNFEVCTLGPRDVTPEATILVCEKRVPGLGELMRLKGLEKTPNAILSRSTAGIRKDTLIINLPGSPKAVRECLDVVMHVLPHALKMMRGGGH
ncbi:MAG: MogA/MoaB family molybdenum cofactor biosynthesis protein [Planctomycetota bacterium]|jgi:molybdopterin biosynthesis enzyme MoaB